MILLLEVGDKSLIVSFSINLDILARSSIILQLSSTCDSKEKSCAYLKHWSNSLSKPSSLTISDIIMLPIPFSLFCQKILSGRLQIQTATIHLYVSKSFQYNNRPFLMEHVILQG